jgi:hypothetical protein
LSGALDRHGHTSIEKTVEKLQLLKPSFEKPSLGLRRDEFKCFLRQIEGAKPGG